MGDAKLAKEDGRLKAEVGGQGSEVRKKVNTRSESNSFAFLCENLCVLCD
jgi:hypothetical protein